MIPQRDRSFRALPEIGHVQSESPVTLLRNARSPSIGIVGHVPSETTVTLVRNTHYRPIDSSGPVTVFGTLTQENGSFGLMNRYESGFLFGTNGSLSSGYEVLFSRSNQSFA